MTYANRSRLPLALATALLLGACAGGQPIVGSGGSSQVAESTNTLQVSDISIPPGAKLDTDSSLIIGANDRWLGRMVLKTDLAPVQAFNHFYNGMGAFGWGLVTAVQARISSLTYLRGERVALIQIEPSSLGGATVAITVSSRQVNSQEPARQK